MSRIPLALVGGALTLVTTLVGAAATPDPDPAPGDGPRWPGSTVVAVEGDADHGFSVHRLDGTSQFPPTLSESTAECEEYDTEVQVEVCLAETRTWFRELAEQQRSLAWALAQ